MQYTNKDDVPLSLAVWLAHSDYDFIPDEKSISATSLLKPVRQVVLERSISSSNKQKDILDSLAAVYGSSLHAAIENAWTSDKLPQTLASLGMTQKVIDRVKVNPIEPEEGDINVYVEKRAERSISGYKISGKFDLVINGHLYDNKSTSVWTYIYKSRQDDYIKQCSIYKWLNPDIITDDTFSINYIFTDWSKSDAVIKAKNGYPQKRLIEENFPFMSQVETENFIQAKLADIDKYIGFTTQTDLPECPESELWCSDTVYKYYANPKNRTRATKVFDTAAEANSYMNQKGKGEVVRAIGKPRRCLYCDCYDICLQRRKYYSD